MGRGRKRVDAEPSLGAAGKSACATKNYCGTIELVKVLAAIVLLVPALLAEAPSIGVRGKLETGDKPVLVRSDGRRIHLQSDEPTMAVLADERLKGSDFEVLGHYESPDRFAVDHIHTRSLYVHKDGKRLMVLYWCDVCYIRTYSPGLCVCCRKYTDLDLRESEDR